jgi:hypothetical protein
MDEYSTARREREGEGDVPDMYSVVQGATGSGAMWDLVMMRIG